jgi:hypothetical protein
VRIQLIHHWLLATPAFETTKYCPTEEQGVGKISHRHRRVYFKGPSFMKRHPMMMDRDTSTLLARMMKEKDSASTQQKEQASAPKTYLGPAETKSPKRRRWAASRKAYN